MMVSIMLTAAIAAQAQLKVTPQMTKGMEKNYTTVSTVDIAGATQFKMNSDMRFTVIDANADGYTVEMLNTGFNTDAAADNLAGRLMSLGEQMMKGLAIRLALNKDGGVAKLLNYDDIKSQTDIMSEKIVDEILKASPQIAQVAPRDALLQKLKDYMTE